MADIFEKNIKKTRCFVHCVDILLLGNCINTL